MSDSVNIRIMTYNVHACVGTDGLLSPERIADVISEHEPDIVALQELDVRRVRSNRVDQPHLIAERLKMKYHFHPAFQVREEHYGDAILAAHPMKLVHGRALPSLKYSLGVFEKRGALWISVRVDNREIQIINTHLSIYPREQRMQAQALLGKDWTMHDDWRSPAIVCGDFNAPPGSSVYKWFRTALRDAQRNAPGHKPKATFSSRRPITRIDHVFVTPEFIVHKVQVARTSLTRVASDHLPLIVDLSLPQLP